MISRKSYRNLLDKPAYGLYGAKGELLATVRADSAEDARMLFWNKLEVHTKRKGARVRRIDNV